MILNSYINTTSRQVCDYMYLILYGVISPTHNMCVNYCTCKCTIPYTPIVDIRPYTMFAWNLIVINLSKV